MPRTIDDGFQDFIKKLTPSSTESAVAKSHRASIEACLRSNFGLQRFYRIGSFGNGTSICGYSDVDYLACIPEYQLTSNAAFSLMKVRRALAIRFPHTVIRVNRPAVACLFGTTAADNTEIVPAKDLRENNGYTVYEIADRGGRWMQASPDAHIDYVSYVDEKMDRKVKPLIRFIKAWKYFREVPISSFYLELRVAKYALTEQSIVYQYDIKNVLKLLLDNMLASIQDPMGISGSIPACITDAQRLEALSKLKSAYLRVNKAIQMEQNDKNLAAFNWWRQVFGTQFPTYYYL